MAIKIFLSILTVGQLNVKQLQYSHTFKMKKKDLLLEIIQNKKGKQETGTKKT